MAGLRAAVGIRGLLLVTLVVAGAPVCGVDPASASLPDGRAWEVVSPPDKNGGGISGIDGDSGGGVVQASAEGNRITYVSLASFADPKGAPGGSQYVADRGAEGWLTQNITLPMNSQTYPVGDAGTPYDAFSPTLSEGLVSSGVRLTYEGHRLPVENPPLAGAPAGYQNYYLRTIPAFAEAGSAHLEALLTHPLSLPAEAFSLEVQGATPDLSHVVVSSLAALANGTVEDEQGPNLYDWEGATGQFQPINVLPDGTPDLGNGLHFGGAAEATSHAISNDGRRVVWEGADLYVREGIGTPKARTLQADASQGGRGEGQGRFFTASGSSGVGSKVFFADDERLTGNSTANFGGLGDLYEFEPDDGSAGKLTDLTVERDGGGSAEVQGVLGASEDGSYLYFVANGVLAPGASSGNCAFPTAPAGATCSLYLWHEGETRFIATLSSNDDSGSGNSALGIAFDWSPLVGQMTARVSPDGTHLVFMSERSLTEYDNTVQNGVSCGQGLFGNPLPAQCEEVFVYDAETNRLNCASCNPSGARPIGPSGIPGGTEFSHHRTLYQSRLLSEDGSRVFFDSDDALVPEDINGGEDVYEYENGHVYLLSSGRGAPASFVDASADGDDVFFDTRAQLVGQDTDQLVDLYDARAPHLPGEAVGFPTPAPPVSCEGEDCRPVAPGVPAPLFASETVNGLGNVAPTAAEPAPVHKSEKAKPRRHVKAKPKRRVKARHGKRVLAGKVRNAKGTGI
jgi:WD40-like Beta Propeller Repeat